MCFKKVIWKYHRPFLYNSFTLHVYHIDRIYYVLLSCSFQPITILIANSHMPDEKNSLTLNFFKYLPLIFTEKILLQVRFYRFFFKFQPLCDFNFSRSSNIPPNFKPFFQNTSEKLFIFSFWYYRNLVVKNERLF